MSEPVDPLRGCVVQLSRFPGIGERTATRLAYWLLRQPADVVRGIGHAIAALPDAMTRCSQCCNISSIDPCGICENTRREGHTICVVERPQDVQAIEAAGEFYGRYHVLGGAIAPLDGVGPEQLNIRELLRRMEPDVVREVLIATDPDVEGDATALYLARLIKPLGVKVTRLAHGIAVGTQIEYADKSSMARAIETRREM
jgi:recombination protein RecR